MCMCMGKEVRVRLTLEMFVLPSSEAVAFAWWSDVLLLGRLLLRGGYAKLETLPPPSLDGGGVWRRWWCMWKARRGREERHGGRRKTCASAATKQWATQWVTRSGHMMQQEAAVISRARQRRDGGCWVVISRRLTSYSGQAAVFGGGLHIAGHDMDARLAAREAATPSSIAFAEVGTRWAVSMSVSVRHRQSMLRCEPGEARRTYFERRHI